MEILAILVPLATLLAVAFLIAYGWAVMSGQFDDTTTPASRILLDDEPDQDAKPSKKR